MKPMRLLVVAFVASACSGPSASQPETTTDVALQEGARRTSTDPEVNPDAAAMAEFKARVDAYADLHKRLATGDAQQKETDDPAKLNARTDALTAKVQAARVDAKHGDIFTPEIRLAFRRQRFQCRRLTVFRCSPSMASASVIQAVERCCTTCRSPSSVGRRMRWWDRPAAARRLLPR